MNKEAPCHTRLFTGRVPQITDSHKPGRYRVARVIRSTYTVMYADADSTGVRGFSLAEMTHRWVCTIMGCTMSPRQYVTFSCVLFCCDYIIRFMAAHVSHFSFRQACLTH